jgi:hypothetical protein
MPKGFKVMAERCDQCLYGPNKIVSDAQRKEILATTANQDTHFVCHKGTIAGTDVCCRGDWDSNGGGRLGRLAKHLGIVRFVTEEDLENA